MQLVSMSKCQQWLLAQHAGGPASRLMHQMPLMHYAKACRPEYFIAFCPKIPICYLVQQGFTKEASERNAFLCLLQETERLNEKQLVLNFVIPGHVPFQINTDSVFSSLFPHTSDRPQHQMPVMIRGNVQDIKHLQNLLIIFVMSQKLDIACRGFPLKRNQIWRAF